MNGSHRLSLCRADELPFWARGPVAASTEQEWLCVWLGQQGPEPRNLGPFQFHLYDGRHGMNGPLTRPLTASRPYTK